MKIKCIDNTRAEHLLTIGKIYDGEEYENGYRIRELDDCKGGGILLKFRFEIVTE